MSAFVLFVLTLLYVWKAPNLLCNWKKYMLFLPQKPVTLAIGSIARGLYFTCIKTETVANAYSYTKEIMPRKVQQFQNKRGRKGLREYLALKSIKSGKWHQNDLSIFWAVVKTTGSSPYKAVWCTVYRTEHETRENWLEFRFCYMLAIRFWLRHLATLTPHSSHM